MACKSLPTSFFPFTMDSWAIAYESNVRIRRSKEYGPYYALLRTTAAPLLSLMPFVDSAELAGILDEPHATVYRTLAGLLPEGTVERVSHGTDQLPSTQRYYLTANAISDRPGSCSALRRHLQPHDEG